MADSPDVSLFPRPRLGAPDVHIEIEDGGKLLDRHFFPKTPVFFKTEEEANQRAVEMGKVAVDNQ